MSDFNEVVKRITTDRAFRSDFLKDAKGTLKAHNYTTTDAEYGELAQLNESKLDQLDESLMAQVVGGAMLTSLSLTTTPLLTNSLNTLYQQNFFQGFQRPGTMAAGTW